MTHFFGATVWIDHHEAKVSSFNVTDVVVRPHDPDVHIHDAVGSAGAISRRTPINGEFVHQYLRARDRMRRLM